ncbi:MAG: ester cyclase [Chloroflexi bacterium]|nr:ester cyclase [Chloroflexota bacterium]
MSPQDNQGTVLQYAQEVWNNNNLGAIEKYIAADYVRHDPGIPLQIRGPEGIRGLVPLYRNAFPDMRFTPEVLVAGEDKVAVLWRVQGTHQGDLMGIPATGKSVEITAMEIFRLADGKIAEQWVAVDNLGMLQQVDAVPKMS